MILTTAAILAVGVGAYGLGRVYPPLGPSAGTIAPAERYVSSQVSESDVTLGDTSVPELMQTDAFELMVHDPKFPRARREPGVQSLGRAAAGHGGTHGQSAGVQRPRRQPAGVRRAGQGGAECVVAGAQVA